MDGLIEMSTEVVVKTTKVAKKRTTKVPNSKFYNYLLECLDKKEHLHMLRYVPNSKKTEFEVLFTDRKNSDWQNEDISLFIELDRRLGKTFDRKRPLHTQINDCKGRFRSNMAKCTRFFTMIEKTKIGKCKIVKKFKILWRPSVGESSSNNQEITGNGQKSKRKSYKKGNKKGSKTIASSVEKDITPGFRANCLGINNVLHLVPQDNNRIQLKNDSEKRENISLENFTCNSYSKITSSDGFEKRDLSGPHYSCLLSNSQMDVDESGCADFLFENLKNSIALIGQDMNVFVADPYPVKERKIDAVCNNLNVDIHASGQNTGMAFNVLCGNSEVQKIASYENIEMANNITGKIFAHDFVEQQIIPNSEYENLDSNESSQSYIGINDAYLILVADTYPDKERKIDALCENLNADIHARGQNIDFLNVPCANSEAQKIESFRNIEMTSNVSEQNLVDGLVEQQIIPRSEYENLDSNENIQSDTGNIYAYLNNADIGSNGRFEENQNFIKGKCLRELDDYQISRRKEIMKSDPFLCSAQTEVKDDPNIIGEMDDWDVNYQFLPSLY